MALLIATAILNLYGTLSSAAPELNSKTIGSVTVQGAVQINGAPVISGQTLFSGSRIRTSTESESILDLGNLARLKLDAETSLTIESSRLGLSASLDNGVVRALVPGGVQADITTADASITTDVSHPAAFSVSVDSCSTTLSVQAGRVRIRYANYLRSLRAGESLSTGDPQLPNGTHNNLSKGKKIGLVMGIGGAITILLIALTREERIDEGSFGGCVIASGESGC